MGNLSSLLSVVVLVIALLSVIVFAFTVQNIRYIYLQQLGAKITRTQEVISASAWYTDTLVVIELKNIGARGVYVKTVKVTIGYVIVYKDGYKTTNSFNKIYTDMYLPPFHKKILAFNILDDIALPVGVERIYINYIAIIVATDKNVYIFDPAPPLDSIVVEINQEDIGKTFTVKLPSGETAKFTVYEYLLCSIGSSSRFTSPISKLEAAKIILAKNPKSIVEGFYNYGYDYDAEKFPYVSIRVSSEPVKLGKDTKVDVTYCIISSDVNLGGRVITVSRGIILLGTWLPGYDIVIYSFAENPYPEYYGGSSHIHVVNGKSHSFILKIPLADKDITVLDFMGPQITPWMIQDKSSVINIGSYYSQAVIIGQSFTGMLVGSGREFEIKVRFGKPYPLLLVIAQPSIKD